MQIHKWMFLLELAKELEFNEDEIQQVRAENPNSLQEQSHALLQRWVEREGKHATGESCSYSVLSVRMKFIKCY